MRCLQAALASGGTRGGGGARQGKSAAAGRLGVSSWPVAAMVELAGKVLGHVPGRQRSTLGGVAVVLQELY